MDIYLALFSFTSFLPDLCRDITENIITCCHHGNVGIILFFLEKHYDYFAEYITEPSENYTVEYVIDREKIIVSCPPERFECIEEMYDTNLLNGTVINRAQRKKIDPVILSLIKKNMREIKFV
jgi:hypothetical protein